MSKHIFVSFLVTIINLAYGLRSTAIFSFPYKMDVLSNDIKIFDFKKPVLDFSLVDNSKLVVLLDGTWIAEGVSASSESTSMVKVLKISGGCVCYSSCVHRIP